MLTERDRVSQMKTATRIGMEKGMEKGMKTGMEIALKQTAVKMKSLNIPLDIIVSCTGLSIEEIEAL